MPRLERHAYPERELQTCSAPEATRQVSRDRAPLAPGSSNDVTITAGKAELIVLRTAWHPTHRCYNFTDYSDDLTDLSFRSRGTFVNVLTAF